MVFVAIDWADHLHAFHVMDGSLKQHSGEFIQEPAVIDEQIAAGRNEFPDTILAVAIEQTRKALVTALLKYEAVEIFPVNPAALASYRKAFRHGGGKNDPTDAMLLAQYLQHYHQHLRPLRLDSPLTRELASLAVDRRRLVDQRIGFANQLQALLKQYFPAILQLKPAKIYAEFILRILLKYPTLAHVQKASTKSLTACFKGTSTNRIEERIYFLRNAVPPTEDEVLLRTSTRKLKTMCRMIEVLNDAIDVCDKHIEELATQHKNLTSSPIFPARHQSLNAESLRRWATIGRVTARHQNFRLRLELLR